MVTAGDGKASSASTRSPVREGVRGDLQAIGCLVGPLFCVML